MIPDRPRARPIAALSSTSWRARLAALLLAPSLGAAAPEPRVLQSAPYAVSGEPGAGAISADGQIVLTVGRQERAARVWLADGTLHGRVLAREADLVTAVAVSADGSVLAVGSPSGVVVYDAATLSPLHDFPTGAAVRALWLGADGALAATHERGLLVLGFDAASVRPAGPDAPALNTLAASPNGDHVAGCGVDHVQIYDLLTRRVLRTTRWDDSQHGYCAGVAFSLDGGTLIVAGSQGTLLRWATRGGEPLPSTALGFGVQAMGGGAANAFLWVIDFEGRVRQLRGDDGAAGPALPYVPAVVEPLVVAPDGRRALVSTAEGPRLVSVSTLARAAAPPAGHGREVVAIEFEADGGFRSWDRGGIWQRWDPAGAPRTRGATGVSETLSVATAGDRTLLAAADRLVLLAGQEIRAELPGRWLSAAADPATGALAAAGPDGSAWIPAGAARPMPIDNPAVDLAFDAEGRLWLWWPERGLQAWTSPNTPGPVRAWDWPGAGSALPVWPFYDAGAARQRFEAPPELPADEMPFGEAPPADAAARFTSARGLALMQSRAGWIAPDRSGSIMRFGDAPERWLRVGATATAAALSPNGDLVIVGFDDGHLELWPLR